MNKSEYDIKIKELETTYKREIKELSHKRTTGPGNKKTRRADKKTAPTRGIQRRTKHAAIKGHHYMVAAQKECKRHEAFDRQKTRRTARTQRCDQ